MKEPRLTRCTIASISIVVFVFAAAAFGCAGGDEDVSECCSFFAPEVLSDSADAPFYVSNRLFYRRSGAETNVDLFRTTNVEEWFSYFDGSVSRQDLDSLLYATSIKQIDTLIFHCKDAAFPIARKLGASTIFKADKQKAIGALYYLGFAKRCEPYAVERTDTWTWQERKDTIDWSKRNAAMARMAGAARKQAASVSDRFLLQRYFFQIVRLYFFARDYQSCTAYYDSTAAAIPGESAIGFRTMCYAAGGLHHLKQLSRANYLYSLIYSKCPPLRLVAFFCFHPNNEKDWKECLALAKSKEERMAIWQIVGIYADPLRAMTEIYREEPASPLLDLLLVRAVNQEEVRILPTFEQMYSKNPAKRVAVSKPLREFVERVVLDRKSHDPSIWNLAAGHLAAFDGDRPVAERSLAAATSTGGGRALIGEQARLSALLCRVVSYAKIDKAQEPLLAKELAWIRSGKHSEALRSDPFYRWSISSLAAIYRRSGDVVRARCMGVDSSGYYFDNPNVDIMLSFVSNSSKSEFDSFLASIYPYSASELVELKALNLLYAHQYTQAAAMFRQDPQSGRRELPGDPFLIHINDCHDCDHTAAKKKTYTKLSFVAWLSALYTSAQQRTGDEAAAAYFDLANGLYNMTYYGNSRTVYDTPHSTFESAAVVTDCGKAEEYYRKAMELSTDKEFKAKACFMASKCEHNRWVRPEHSADDFQAGNYFKMLKKSFAGTKYYQEIIKECGYFRTFAGR